MIYILLIQNITEITMSIMLYKVLKKLDEMNKKNNANNTAKRTHPIIKKSNYENAFGGRKAYEVYKNKNGLYEPITPTKGIDLKKKEE